MSPVTVTLWRTVNQSRRRLSTVFAVFCFLVLAAVLAALGMESGDGTRLALPAIWAIRVAPILPALAILLSMDVWSSERQSGRIDVLLSTAVRERDYVFGKFAGVFLLLVVSILLSCVSTVLSLALFAPEAFSRSGIVSFAPAVMALVLQGVLWSAAGVAFSALFRTVVAALSAAMVFLVALPRLLWLGLQSWSGDGRIAFGEMPLDAHVMDLATGIVPVGTVAAYLVLSCVFLFAAAKFVAFGRMVGRGARGIRITTTVAIVLAFAAGALSVALAMRVNPTVEIAGGAVSPALTTRTRDVLRESSGSMTVTCFLARRNVRFREVGRMLRLLKRESELLGGVRIDVRYVDPHWDIGAAGRLVRSGVSENSLVFEKGSRSVAIPIGEGFGERVCTATICRLTQPHQRRNVYWTIGHGESAFDAYDAFGMSDIARDLVREGYLNAPLDLAARERPPADCALVIVAGARDDFSRAEIGRLDAYLREGGRLLVLLGGTKAAGLNALLTSWGMRPADPPQGPVSTMSGSDVVVSSFADHPVSTPLKRSRIVLERPTTFVPSAVAGVGAGADRIGYSPIALAGPTAVAAAVDRGVGAGQDLALRPTRIVAIGDAGFALNGQLAARACANRDFFLNCVSYLSGSDTYGSGEGDASAFRLDLDRRTRIRFVLVSALGIPTAVFLLMIVGCRRRRAA